MNNQHAAYYYYSFVVSSSAFHSFSVNSSVTFSVSIMSASGKTSTRLSLIDIMPCIAKFNIPAFFAFHEAEVKISLIMSVSRDTFMSEAISLITLQLFVSLVVLRKSRRAAAPWMEHLGELGSKFSMTGSRLLANVTCGGP